MGKFIIICASALMCFIVVCALIAKQHNNEIEKEYVKMGLEQCKANSWEREYIWVKNCSDYIKARNGGN